MAAFVYHLIRRHTLNFSITYKISIEFQMEIKIICHRGFGSQTTQIVVISRCCLLGTAKKCTKFKTHLLSYCSAN